MKCKDKSVVTDIDYGSDANQFKGLYLDEEGYVTKSVTVNVAIRGIQKCNVYHVTAIEGNQVTVERLLFHGGKVETFTMDETTKIYNTDYLADCLFDYVGQPVESLQINDRVIVYTDVFGTAKYVFLTKRMVGAGRLSSACTDNIKIGIMSVLNLKIIGVFTSSGRAEVTISNLSRTSLVNTSMS